MASKQVTDRQKSAESVIAIGETQASAMGAALTAQLQPHVRDGETLPDMGLLAQLLARTLSRRRDELVAADQAHETELADDAPARQERDTKTQSLFGRLVELRELLQGLFGAELVQAVMPTHTPADPVVLSRFAGEVIAALSATAFPPPRLPGAALDIPALVADLQQRRDELDAQLALVALEAREAQATLVARNRAMDAYDQVFAGVTTTLSGMLQLAGEHELASRVRPTRRRTGRPAADTTPLPDPIDTPAPAPAA